MTGRYIRTTFVEDQREFVEHFQYGKQIGKMLDIKNKQKRPQTPTPILLGLESEKTENHIVNLKISKHILNLLTIFVCIMAVTLFQTSS